MNTNTTNSNVNDLIDFFVKQMSEQGTALSERIAQLDATYKAERADLAGQLVAVDRALSAVKTKATTQTGIAFKPARIMSETGRQNIRLALAARRDRLAAKAAGKVAEPAEVAEAATEEQSEVAEVVAAEPVAETVVEAAAESVVKTTALERDVLVGGLLQNNFQDGAGGTQSIWSNQIIDNGSCKVVTAKQLPGVVASLVKKGLVVTDGEAVTLTATGLKVAKEFADA